MLLFKSPDHLFTVEFIVDLPVPYALSITTCKSAKDFKLLSANSKNEKLFQNLILFPSFVVLAILSISSRNPADIAISIAAFS